MVMDRDDLDRIVKAKWERPLVVPTPAVREAESPEQSDSVYPREESVDRAVTLLLPLLGLSAFSPAAEQLRRLLIDQPEVDTVSQLRTYLADPNRPSEPRTPEFETVSRRLVSAHLGTVSMRASLSQMSEPT